MDDVKIRLAGLYENQSKAGNRYFVGLLNSGAKLLMLENKRAGEGEPGWSLFLTEHEKKPAATRKTPPLKQASAPADAAMQAPLDDPIPIP
jgi:hypothetical protein